MSESQTKSTVRFRELGIAIAIVLLAAMLRLYRLDDESLWYDEVVSVQYLDAPAFASFMEQERTLDPAIVPVYFYLEYLWWHAVSGTEYGLRLLSVILGLMTVVAVYWMGRNIFSPRAGAIAALCTAFAQSQIYYSQEIRMYVLMYLLAAVSTLMLERALVRGGSGWWFGHWLASALLMWTHLLGALVLFAQGLAILWIHRRRIPKVFLWSAAQCLYLIPLAWWIFGFTRQSLDEHLTWIASPAPWKVVDTFWTVMAGTELDATRGFLPHNAGAVLSHAVATLLWCCVGRLVWKAFRSWNQTAGDAETSSPGPGTLLLALWCTVPVLMLVVLSLAVRPCYVERYVGHCALPLFVLAGGGIDCLSSRRLRLAFVVLLAAGYAVVDAQWQRPLRPDLLTAAGTIERKSDGNEYFFLESRFDSGYAFEYYTDIDTSRIVMGADYVRLAIERVENQQSAWMLTVGGSRDMRQFENACKRSNMNFTRYVYPGRRRTTLIHAVPKTPGAKDSESP